MFFCVLQVKLLLLFFALLLTRSESCWANAIVNSLNTSNKSVAIFLSKETNFSNSHAPQLEDNYNVFELPYLTYVNGTLIVIAQGKNTKQNGKQCDIVEGYAKFESNAFTDVYVFGNLSLERNNGNWKQNSHIKNNNFCTEFFLTAFSKKDLALLLKIYDNTFDSIEEYGFAHGVFETNKNKMAIKWNIKNLNLIPHQKTVSRSKINITPVAGCSSAIETETNFVSFSMFKTRSGIVSTIMKSKKDYSNFSLIPNNFPVNCVFPAVVEWNGQLVLMLSCSDGTRRVYKSKDMEGIIWTEAVESLSHVLGNTEKRTQKMYGGLSGFIVADIGENEKKRKVLLFTHPVEKEKQRYDLHLWASDYKRMYDVGEIATSVGENASSTLLYAEGNLFGAYEKWDGNKSSIYAVHLKDELEKIKNVLEKWDKQDESLSMSCFKSDLELRKNGQCKNNISTDGLVGFLSNNYTNNTWVDKYFCVNASGLNDPSKVINMGYGVKFDGCGAGATWPVSAQGQNQRYHFTGHVFTLVAIVKPHTCVRGMVNSVLGFGLGGDKSNTNGVGLWCVDGMWHVGNGKNTSGAMPTAMCCEREQSYHVAFVLQNKTFSVYIDGNNVSRVPEYVRTVKDSLNITHFYFGVNTYGGSQNNIESHVTVKNVFLYNRPFNSTDIEKVKEIVNTEQPYKKARETCKPNLNTIYNEAALRRQMFCQQYRWPKTNKFYC